MTLKNDGRERNSKASKNKKKPKQIKCSCKNMVEYYEEDIIRIGNIKYIECNFCGKEIKLK